jgi:calcium-dependent protein kinase
MNNQIDYSEFVAAAIDKQSIFTEQRLKDCFKLFDINSDGQISIKEFRQIFEGDQKRPDEVWVKMINDVTNDP